MLLTAAAVVLFLLALLPFLAWWSRTWTITTKRVIERSGIFVPRRRELTHVRGYAIQLTRGPIQRLWRAGTLVLSNGVDEPMRLANIPSADLVNECLVDQVEVNQILAHRELPLPQMPAGHPDPSRRARVRDDGSSVREGVPCLCVSESSAAVSSPA